MRRRDYGKVIARVTPSPSREAAMCQVVDLLWSAFGATHLGVSWVGFYIDRPDQPDDRRLVLGPCRDKPACSPIGLHGVCGQALTAATTRVVEDVRELGSAYIACDPRDRAEIVIPLFGDNQDALPWGVLDVDSWDVAAFDDADEAGLRLVLRAAGLCASK